jgi:hypothetical protein
MLIEAVDEVEIDDLKNEILEEHHLLTNDNLENTP